ncbi:hypothetical protein FHG87_018450 [Trinorchestia longiramus]|nr:hypothetical protein FHG87_018450 [Trinorchestia longiramus]
MDNIVTKPSSAVEAPETIHIKSEEPVDESECTVKDEPFDWLSETQVETSPVIRCFKEDKDEVNAGMLSVKPEESNISAAFINMAKRQKVDQTLKQNVVILHKKNFSIREIAVKVKRSKSVVGRILKLYSDLGHIPTACKTGRQRITSNREDRIIQRVALKNRFETAAGISRKVCETNQIKVCSSNGCFICPFVPPHSKVAARPAKGDASLTLNHRQLYSWFI